MIEKLFNAKETLNEEQLNVANNLNGKILVLAGAGSGKTRLITHSVAKLINLGVPPNQIMLVTFTNKASEEMLVRVKTLLDFMPHITAGTFHSIAHRVFLYRFKKLINCDKYEILNEQKAKDLIKKCIDDACMDEIISDPKYNPSNLDEENTYLKELKKKYPKAKHIKEIISCSTNCNKSIVEIMNRRFQQFTYYLPQIIEINRRFKAVKMKFSKFDFDDLLDLWNKLLEFEDVQKFARQYKYILVDEYQDTNFVQNEIIIKIAKLSTDICLMVVGDDAQSIYAFRGANFKNFLDFRENFNDCERYKLTINYRSTPEILALANNSIRNNLYQYSKNMKTDKISGMKPLLVEAENLQEQMDWIINKVIKLSEEGTTYKEIAILFRSLQGERDEIYYINNLMVKLRENKVPFEVRGGKSIFEKAHVRDILAFLGFRHNAKDIFAEVYWNRISENYILGLGKINAKKIYNNIICKVNNPLHILTDPYSLKSEIHKVKRKLKQEKFVFRLNEKAIDNIVNIIKTFLSFKGSVGEIIHSFIKNPLFYEIFEGLYNFNKSNNDDFQERLKDIDLLIEVGKEFKTIGQFLNNLSLNENEYIRGNNEKEKNADKLIISTIHRAKGLEWSTIFIPMLQLGFFPSFQNIDNKEDLEEERRLFYVAVTRTKTNLFLLYSKLNRKKDTLECSSFIKELDNNLYNKIILNKNS